MAREVPISLDPNDAELGGFLDDVDGEILECEAVVWDYDGKYSDSPAIKLVVQLDDADEPLRPQYLSAGSLKRVTASKDGETFVAAPGSKAKGLWVDCNAMIFLRSLVEAGLSSKLLGKLSNLVGMNCHFTQIPAPKREGLKDPDADSKTARPKTALTVSEINSMPGEKKSKGKVAKKHKPVEEEEEEEEEEEDFARVADLDLDDEAEGYIMALLKEPKHKKGIAADELAQLVFQKAKGSENRKAVLSLIQEDDWLNDKDRPFSYDGETVTK